MKKLSNRYSNKAILKNRKRNYEIWLKLAKKKHGKKFNYLGTDKFFTTQKKSTLNIKCNIHGFFKINAHAHVRREGGGCKPCGYFIRGNKRKENKGEIFLKYFEDNFSNQLSLITKYNGMHEIIKIRCLKHETEDETTPNNLMYSNAHGCNICASLAQSEKRRLSKEDIHDTIAELPKHVKFIKVFFDKKLNISKIKIKCEFDGIFDVTHGFLSKSRYKCPECGNRMMGQAAYRLQDIIVNKVQSFHTEIGLMEIEVFNIKSLKIGISINGLKKRYRHFLKKIFYSQTLDEKDAIILENRIKSKFVKYKDNRILNAGMRNGSRWGGDTEFFYFKAKDLIMKEIKIYNNLVSNNKIDYNHELNNYQPPEFGIINISRKKDLSNLPKKIVCLSDNNRIFESISAASVFYKISGGNLSAILRKNTQWHNKKKLRFCYYDDFIKKTIPPIQKKKIIGRKVKCIDNGKIYESITIAAKETGATGSHITSVCKGKRNLSGGFKWEYYKD